MLHNDNADSKVLWMDGKFVPYAEATVHVLTHSLHYGTGIFEGMRAYQTPQGDTVMFRATEHYQRFLDSMKAMGYSTTYTISDFITATRELINQNGLKECYVRPLAYIDDSIRGLKMPNQPKARVAIAAWNWGKYMGDEGAMKGIRVMVSTFRRPDISSAMTWAKLSGNYLISVLARQESTKHGMDEAVLLDPLGFIAEGSGENLFMVKDGVLFTPNTGYILPGITRDSVMKMAKAMGYSIHEGNITRNQLYLADEVFFTGTAVEVTAIREVDNRQIGSGKPGPVTMKLAESFFKCVKGELPQYKEWLTKV